MNASTRPNAGTKGVARPEREAQILEVAGRVFGESGYAATSVADVADAAGISKPLIYNYFGSKEGLYAACLRSAGDVLAGEIERTARMGAVGLDRALVTLEGIFTVLSPQPWLWRLFFDPSVPRTGEIDRTIAGYTHRITALAEEGVAELMALSGKPDPLDVSAMTAVWSSIFDALVTWWLDHSDQTPAQMTDRCVRLFSAAFGETGPAALAALEHTGPARG